LALLTRPETIDVESIPHWCGLEILKTEQGQDHDSEGLVGSAPPLWPLNA
jgi:hypothetical protein